MTLYIYGLAVFQMFLGSVCSLQSIAVCTQQREASCRQHVIGGGFKPHMQR